MLYLYRAKVLLDTSIDGDRPFIRHHVLAASSPKAALASLYVWLDHMVSSRASANIIQLKLSRIDPAIVIGLPSEGC